MIQDINEFRRELLGIIANAPEYVPDLSLASKLYDFLSHTPAASIATWEVGHYYWIRDTKAQTYLWVEYLGSGLERGYRNFTVYIKSEPTKFWMYNDDYADKCPFSYKRTLQVTGLKQIDGMSLSNPQFTKILNKINHAGNKEI